MINLAITRMENAPRTRSRKILLRTVIRFISRYLTNTFPNPRFKIIHDYFTRILFQKYLQKQQQSIYIYDRCFVHILRNLEISNFLYTYIISFFIPQWNSTRRNGVIPIKNRVSSLLSFENKGNVFSHERPCRENWLRTRCPPNSRQENSLFPGTTWLFKISFGGASATARYKIFQK